MASSLEYQDWLRELETPRLMRTTIHASTPSAIHSEMFEGLPRDKTTLFLLRFPEYRRTLRLAVFHEESSAGNRFYRGWRWLDVETPPSELPRLVIEEIAMVNLRTKHATYYLLRDREAVKEALRTVTDLTAPAVHRIIY